MDQAEKLSITLPASLARIVREKVKTGAYASNSEVIREALRAWQERETAREQRLQQHTKGYCGSDGRSAAFDPCRSRSLTKSGSTTAGR